MSEIPGTTRDAVDTVLERGGRTFVLIDTAGLRRKRRHRRGVEYYSELRALEAAERADVALVLIDSSEGIVEQDISVADVARHADCSTLVVLSKWDVTTIGVEDVRCELRRRLRQRPPFVAVSSQSGPRPRAAARRRRRAVRPPHRPDSDARAEPRIRRAARGAAAAERAARPPAQPSLRRADPRPAAALSLLRQRPGPRHARLRLLGREPAARALRPRGSAGLDRLRETILTMRFLVVGAGSWGTAFTRVLLERGHDVVLACRSRRAGRGDRAHRLEPALPAERRPQRGRGGHPRGRSCRCRRRRRRRPEPGLRRGRRSAAGRCARAQPREGARPGDRRAPVDSRPRASRGRALRARTSRRRSRRTADSSRDRERGRLPRRSASACTELEPLPRLRQRRPGRRRALRRGEERDRACSRRRRRAPAGRQREGLAHRSRPRRDDASRRGGGRKARDVRRPRGDRRPRGQLLQREDAQPARRAS